MDFTYFNLSEKIEIDCDGTGMCFRYDLESDQYYKFGFCKHKCEFDKCYRCGLNQPQWITKRYYGLCTECGEEKYKFLKLKIKPWSKSHCYYCFERFGYRENKVAKYYHQECYDIIKNYNNDDY